MRLWNMDLRTAPKCSTFVHQQRHGLPGRLFIMCVGEHIFVLLSSFIQVHVGTCWYILVVYSVTFLQYFRQSMWNLKIWKGLLELIPFTCPDVPWSMAMTQEPIYWRYRFHILLRPIIQAIDIIHHDHIYGGFRKWGYLQIIHSKRSLQNNTSILGYPPCMFTIFPCETSVRSTLFFQVVLEVVAMLSAEAVQELLAFRSRRNDVGGDLSG